MLYIIAKLINIRMDRCGDIHNKVCEHRAGTSISN